MKARRVVISAALVALAMASPVGAAGAEEGAASQSGVMAISWMNRPEIFVEDTYPQKYLEERYGIDIKMYPIQWNEFVQTQQLTLASGDIPDVMWIRNPSELQKYADQGFLAPVAASRIKELAPRMVAVIDGFCPEGWFSTAYRGKNYGFPGTEFTGQYYDLSGWRTDLLRKAGVPNVPDTLDQMETAFAALKKINVYGMTTKGNHAFHAFHTIFGAYGVMPPYWRLKDGSVKNGAVLAETRDALALLARWYAQGWIDPEFVTGKDVGPKFVAGVYAYQDLTYSLDLDATNPASQISAIRKVNPEGDIVLARAPAGPGGRGSWISGRVGSIWAFGRQVEKDAPKMAKILQIFEETLNDEDAYIAVNWGVKDLHWQYVDASKGMAGGLAFKPPYDVRKNREEAGFPSSGGTMNIWTGQAKPDIVKDFWNKRRYEASLEYGSDGVSDLLGKPDLLPSSGKYWQDLLKLKIETYAAIVRGDKPVSAFDEYLKQWNALGGAELEREANELYQQVNNRK